MRLKTKQGEILALRNGECWDLYRGQIKIAECYTHLKAPSKQFLLDNAISPLKTKQQQIKDVYNAF